MKISALFETDPRDILPLAATDNMIAKAKAFALRKWRERALERGVEEPVDLTSSCKFTSQFAQKLFGGTLRGNTLHQWLVVDGRKIDLNDDAVDVLAMANFSREQHDRRFFGNREHRESMQSCLPRIEQWVDEFVHELHVKPLAETIFHAPADFAYKTDNPGMEGCMQKRQTVERMSKEAGGPRMEGLAAKMCTGWPTAHMGIFRPMYFPVKNLLHLDGVNNEQVYRNPGEVKYDNLAKSVAEKGWVDKHQVMIRVNHRGMAYVVEGNTRIRIAAANGIRYIRAQFEWMNGVEVDEKVGDGPWSPVRVAELSLVDPLNEAASA